MIKKFIKDKKAKKIINLCSIFEEARNVIIEPVDINPDSEPCIGLAAMAVEYSVKAENLYGPKIDRAVKELKKDGRISDKTLSEFKKLAGLNIKPSTRLPKQLRNIHYQRFVDEISDIQDSKLYKKVMKL